MSTARLRSNRVKRSYYRWEFTLGVDNLLLFTSFCTSSTGCVARPKKHSCVLPDSNRRNHCLPPRAGSYIEDPKQGTVHPYREATPFCSKLPLTIWASTSEAEKMHTRQTAISKLNLLMGIMETGTLFSRF